MAVSSSQTLRTHRSSSLLSGTRPAPRHTGAWLRLGLGVAGILALIAWGIVDAATRDQAPNTAPEASAVFDGQGKWSGIAR